MDGNSCEECVKKELNSVSTIHCFECDLRMCVTCKNKHSRSRVKKKHHLIRIDDAPKGVLLSFLKSFRTCADHPKEEVVFRCNSHDIMCCGLCATEAHKGCDDVMSIVDASKVARDEDLKKTTLNDYDKVAERARKELEDIYEHIETLETSKAKLNTNLDEIKDHVTSSFDDFSRKAKADFENQSEESVRIRKDMTHREYCARKFKELLVLAIDSNDDIRTYLVGKKLQEMLKDLEPKLEQSVCKPKLPDFQYLKECISDAFIPTKAKRLLCDCQNINEPSSSAEQVEIIRETKNRKSILIQSFAVDDTIAFNDCTWMNEEQVVLIDPAQNKLYSYYVYQNTVEELLKLPTMPWCVEAIDINVVAASFHAERLVRFYKVYPGEASIMETMYVNDMCFGIQYIKDESALYVLFKSLVVITEKQAEIRIFAIDPKNLRSAEPEVPNYINQGERKLGNIELDKEATESLARSTSFRITRDRNLLIVCCSTHEVSFIDMKNGSIISKYDPDMFNPVFVDTDNNGYIYVVWTTNSTIHMLSRNGKFIREILTGQDGLALPSRLYFNNDCDKFIVIDQNRRKQLKLFNYA